MSLKSCLSKFDEPTRHLISERKASVCHFCVFGSFSEILVDDVLELKYDGCSLKVRQDNQLRYDCSDFALDTELD